MKKYLLFLLIFVPFKCLYSQEKFKVFFERSVDTLYTDSQKEASQSFKIIVPKQDKFKDATIKFSIIKNELMPREVFLPLEKTITFKSTEDTMKKEFRVKFHRDTKDDRLLILQLTATDKEGKTLSLADSNIIYKVYIKPQSLGSINDGHEFWLFTGTNIDLLDGIKAKELYFKGSYLVNLKKQERRHKKLDVYYIWKKSVLTY